jgi:hypothetical protein
MLLGKCHHHHLSMSSWNAPDGGNSTKTSGRFELELCRYSSHVLLCFCDSVCSVCSVPLFELTSDIASATVGRCVPLLTLFPGATLYD